MAEKVDYAPLKKGGFMRQKQKGCFSLRIAVVGGNLTAENIKTVAEVAEKYGHGYVHMTSRQGIEIPFIKVEDINVVKEELAKGGVGTGVWDREYVLSQRVRAQKSVLADVSIHILWLRNLMKDTSEESFLTSSSLVSQAVRTTA